MPTKQISAVDWLVNELKTSKHYQRVINEVNQSSTDIKDIINQAKEIEKQNIINGYHVGYSRAIMPKDYNAQEYYEQNFNKEI